MANKYFEGWFKFLEKAKWLIIIFWAVIFVFALLEGPKFLKQTKAAMNPPPGSDADVANDKFSLYFPASDELKTLIILIQRHSPGSVLGSYLKEMTTEFNQSLRSYSSTQNVIGFYTFADTELAPLSASFISPDAKSSIIQVKYTKYNSQTDLGDYIQFLRDTIKPYANDEYDVGLTGQDALFQDIIDGTGADMARMDIIVLPLALLTLAYVVRNYRLMIIPIVSVAISLLTGYWIMLPISLHVYDCSSVCPSVMMSLTIAMSIDYSLFLLTRYREEHEKGKDNVLAVKNMEFFGGHIVAMSGGTLAITFIALAFFPLDFLKSVGVGACLALLCTMSVNLSLTPALLLAFGGFFSNFGTPWIVQKLCPCFVTENKKPTPVVESINHQDQIRASLLDKASNASFDDASILREANDQTDYREQRKQIESFWYQSAVFSTKNRNAIAIIVGVTCVAVPFIVQVFSMNTTIDTNQLIPRNAPALGIYNNFMDSFPPGTISPYQITMVTPSMKRGGAGVLDPYVWSATQNLATQLQSRTSGVDASSISAISWYGGGNMSLSDAESCLSPANDTQYCAVYRTIWKTLVTPDLNVTYMSIDVNFDPTGDDSPNFISDARDVVSDFRNWYPDIEFYLNGGAVNTYDAVAEVHRLFPAQVAGTSAAVFIIVGLLFRSVFVPIRLLITIALPITWIYGLSVIVFQDGVVKSVNSLYWLIPVMCFSILVGLGLDYDIFLFSRVVEYRKLGYNDTASIVKGIYRTGGIITAAGIIMFISFSGLMLSSEMALNQYGFMLAFAVLVDTFIVRTLLVPAIMQLAGPVNWWPGSMPPTTKDVMCQVEEPEDLGLQDESKFLDDLSPKS